MYQTFNHKNHFIFSSNEKKKIMHSCISYSLNTLLKKEEEEENSLNTKCKRVWFFENKKVFIKDIYLYIF
jgi:hypothetical protein